MLYKLVVFLFQLHKQVRIFRHLHYTATRISPCGHRSYYTSVLPPSNAAADDSFPSILMRLGESEATPLLLPWLWSPLLSTPSVEIWSNKSYVRVKVVLLIEVKITSGLRYG